MAIMKSNYGVDFMVTTLILMWLVSVPDPEFITGGGAPIAEITLRMGGIYICINIRCS